jgi:hypothetical protein
MDMPMKFKDKVSLFLCLNNDINKNMLLANVIGFNILRNNDDDDVNLGKMISMASTTDGTWMQHAQDRSQSASSSESDIRFVGSLIVFHWEGHNSSIRSAIEVNAHSMESLFDKLSNRSGPTLILCQQGLQIINTCCDYFCQELRHHHGFVIHPWDPGPS